MRLEKITEKNIEYVLRREDGSLRRIFCYEYSPSYLREMWEVCGISCAVERVIDPNPRNHGLHNLMGRQVEVCSTDMLEGTQGRRRQDDLAPCGESSSLTACGCPGLPESGLLPCRDGKDSTEAALVITSDYYGEAFEKLSMVPGLGERVDTVYYFSNQETEYDQEYRRLYRERELENLILFRSGPHASSYVKGMDFADNARALYEYMLANHYNEKYRLVWLGKHPEDFGRYEGVKNVEFLSFDWSVSRDKEERDRYYQALCLARYIFFTDAYGFARNSRPDQVRVQLWHGCGFKTRVNFVRCENRYEYTTVISELYAGIHRDIYGLREDQVLVTGYAKEDWLFHPLEEEWKELGLPEGKTCVFWLPTFRMARENLELLNEYDTDSQTGLPVVDTWEKLGRLDRLLEDLDTVLVLKLHPFQDRGRLASVSARQIAVLDNDMLADRDIQINQLLGHSDGLISDYSSAAVDYMLLDRPIGFTVDDVEEYRESRGFVFDPVEEWLPGTEIKTFDDFCRFVREVAMGVDSAWEKRRELMRRMHRYGDDNSCRRIVHALDI